MKQVVQFVPTAGGRVAYSVVGSGPPLVCHFGWVTHLGLMWDLPRYRRFVQELAREHTVVRYDRPGCGLSDRGAPAASLESELELLESVVGHLGLARFGLFGSCDGGQVAAAYAAARPDAVNALVAYGSCARGADLAQEPVRRSLLEMVRAHWGLGSRMLADIWLPGAPTDTVDWFARFQRTSTDGETAAQLLDLFYRLDVTDRLGAVRAPTLVLHRRGSRAVPFELGRRLASMIPGARMDALDGRMQPVYAEGEQEAATAVNTFLREHSEPASPAVPVLKPVSRIAVVRPLTGREREVVGLIVAGSTNAEIGQALGVSVRTVDAHVEHVRAKLGLRTRTQIAVWGSREGLGSSTHAEPAVAAPTSR
jgi:pimeloyl-ACP methyl ester carboxylesterase/DNA-binding CsgD family transcriptional regulator